MQKKTLKLHYNIQDKMLGHCRQRRYTSRDNIGEHTKNDALNIMCKRNVIRLHTEEVHTENNGRK